MNIVPVRKKYTVNRNGKWIVTRKQGNSGKARVKVRRKETPKPRRTVLVINGRTGRARWVHDDLA